ncbi:ATPase [Aeromicrobium sp. Root344]|uniref:SRPBCC family protein n=1 Tax=Aeromicrobium sp. Root344 TaxID=1736521 RepID=UPI0006FA00CC|nr:SRPBCC family protein [Aeromicrobium sp. Root344]KQV77110.1 ATPase [Aeromicrobium sp. Root344]
MTGRTDTASRRINATPEALYRALTDAAARVRWLPPAGMSARMERYDLKVGGGYRMVLTYDDPAGGAGKSTADSDVVEATFVELADGERVVEAIEFESDDPAFAGTMTMTWQLAPLASGVEVSIVASGVPTGISPIDHATGMQSSLANLAAFVESA